MKLNHDALSQSTNLFDVFSNKHFYFNKSVNMLCTWKIGGNIIQRKANKTHSLKLQFISSVKPLFIIMFYTKWNNLRLYTSRFGKTFISLLTQRMTIADFATAGLHVVVQGFEINLSKWFLQIKQYNLR